MADPAQLNAEIEKYERRYAENPAGRDFVPLANAYRKLGELERAEQLLRTGLQRHPEYLSAHIVLGRVLADRGAAGEAASEFRRVLSVDPQNLIALRTLGELASADGRVDEAGYWYRELLAVDPMNDEARAALEELDGAAAGAEFQSGGGWWEDPAAPESQPQPAEPEGELAEPEADRWGREAPSERSEPMVTEPIAGHAESEPVEPVDPQWHAEDRDEPAEADRSGFEVDVEPGPMPEPVAAMDAEVLEPEPSYGELEPVDSGELEPDEREPSGTDVPEDLASETLAELYANQGFVDEAVAMYRELIRRRGEHPELLRRLGELEEQAEQLAPSPAGPDGPPAWIDPTDPAVAGGAGSLADERAATDEAGESEAAGSGAVAGPEPAPVEWSGPEVETSPGRTTAEAGAPAAEADPFADSFESGFPAGDEEPEAPAWHQHQPSAEDAPVAALPEPPSTAEPASAGAAADPGPVHGRTIAAALGTLLAWRPPLPGAAVADAAAGPTPAAAEVAPQAAAGPPSAPDDDEPFPWELPPPADLGEPVAGREPESGEAELRAAREQPPGDDADTESAESPRGSATAPDGAAARPTGAWDTAPADDDDDLESFQAWLRSLKR